MQTIIRVLGWDCLSNQWKTRGMYKEISRKYYFFIIQFECTWLVTTLLELLESTTITFFGDGSKNEFKANCFD